jgi:predicted nucleic acid-binding protein
MRVLIDTSAIIAVIVGEKERDRIISLTRNKILIAPFSVHWEIGNAFSAFFKQHRISLDQAITAIELYRKIPIQFIEPDLVETLKIAAQFNIYAYDAYLLTVALSEKLPLLTLDKKLAHLAKQMDVLTL